MTTKITVIYDNPTSSEAFEAGYPEQLSLATRIPELERLEASRVWPKEDRSPTPAYRLLDIYFPNYETASEAVTTSEAQAFLATVGELATGGVQIVFADVEEAWSRTAAEVPARG